MSGFTNIYVSESTADLNKITTEADGCAFTVTVAGVKGTLTRERRESLTSLWRRETELVDVITDTHVRLIDRDYGVWPVVVDDVPWSSDRDHNIILVSQR